MSEEKVVLVARLKVKEEGIEPIKDAALALVAPSRAEAGCLNYDVHQSIEDETVFVWHETWKNKAVLDEHFQQPYFTNFFAVVNEFAVEPPQIILTRMISEETSE